VQNLSLVRALVFAGLTVVLCCGCSSGGSVLPPINGTTGMTAGGGAGFSPESRFQSDPRFKGFVGSDSSAARSGAAANPPSLPYPHYSQPEFDKVLHGLFSDPRKELDPLSLTGTIDEETDISDDLTYRIEYLPYGGLLYHWECKVPEEFGDWESHLVDLQIKGDGGRIFRFLGTLTIGHVGPPTIKFAVYPWRDLSAKYEEQKPDPARILVVLNGKVWPEWETVYSSPLAWSVDGAGPPVKIELDQDRVSASLWLADALKTDSTLRLGPIDVEGKTVEDSYPIPVGSGSKDGDCDCEGLSAETLQTNDHWETDDNAWAYEIIQPDGCHTYWENHLVSGYPLCNDNHRLDYWQTEDTCTLGEYEEDPSLWPWLPFSTSPGKHTFFVGTTAASMWHLELGADCGEGNPPWSASFDESFMRADVNNP
jgi:hypothetical protein